jgi:SAM-dependent methyltransferase
MARLLQFHAALVVVVFLTEPQAMKRRLLDWIVCPQCGKRPRLAVSREEKVPLPGPVRAPACRFYCARHEIRAPQEIEPPPDCAACFREEILEGTLACACGGVYPIVDGIPRLTRQEAGGDRRSARSFRLQWTIYRDGDLTWFKDDAGLRKREFLDNLEVSAEELPGRTLLDAGCGNGELTRAVAEYGLEVVAMDFSRSVDGARRRLFEQGYPVSHRVHYLQGDVLVPPFLPGSFDLVHSSGVLHHTPSTERAFRSVARLPRPGGKLYVQLYRRRENWVHYTNVALRAVTTRLPMRLLYALCYAATPLHAALSRLVHRLRREPPPPRATARERAVQMFDNYSPRFQYRHTVPEIVRLFESAGYEEMKDVTLPNEARHMLAVLGRRRAEAEKERERAEAVPEPERATG